MTAVYVAIGSNLEDRRANVEKALEFIREIPQTQIERVSALREYTAEELAINQPAFLNGVLHLQTELMPLELLHKLQVIERKMGRQNKGDGSPRAMDLDILSFGGEIIFQGKNLTVPHPRLEQRIFVLEPLVELCPDWRHPKSGRTAAELLSDLKATHADLPDSPVATAGTEATST